RQRREVEHFASDEVRIELIRGSSEHVDALEVVLEPRSTREEVELAVLALAVDGEPTRQREADLVTRRPIHAESAVDEHGVACRDRESIRVSLAGVERAPGLGRRIEQTIDPTRLVERRIPVRVRVRDAQTEVHALVEPVVPVDALSVLPQTRDDRHPDRVTERTVEVVVHGPIDLPRRSRREVAATDA